MKILLFKKPRKGYIHSMFVPLALLSLLVVIGLSCEKQGSFFSSNPQQTSSSQQITSAATSSSVSSQQALDLLNDYFKNIFYSVSKEQVKYVSKQQFLQWLRSSKIAAAEQQFLGALLSVDGNRFILLNKVTLRETNEQATLALIAVSQQVSAQYKRLLVLTDFTKALTNPKLCMWNRCDLSQPCPCFKFISYSSVSGCPPDRCVNQSDCQGFDPANCNETTYIDLFDEIKTTLDPW